MSQRDTLIGVLFGMLGGVFGGFVVNTSFRFLDNPTIPNLFFEVISLIIFILIVIKFLSMIPPDEKKKK